jgi:hypothetical protein
MTTVLPVPKRKLKKPVSKMNFEERIEYRVRQLATEVQRLQSEVRIIMDEIGTAPIGTHMLVVYGLEEVKTQMALLRRDMKPDLKAGLEEAVTEVKSALQQLRYDITNIIAERETDD